jgi:drug/metabolite transporter (DMT)-like permease
MMRYAIGFLCLAPIALFAGRVRIAGRDLAPICLLGIVQFGVLIALLNYGLQTIPAGRAALILATFPLLTMVFAALLGREALTGARTAGVLLTIAGVGIALSEAVTGTVAIAADWRGEAAVLAAAAAGAICSVLYRPYLQRYPALAVSTLAMLASIAALSVPAAFEGAFTGLPRLSPGGWAAVVFIGVSSGVGYFLWLWALSHASPTRVTIFLSLSPLTAAALGMALLGEPVTLPFLAGLVGVAGGLWLGTRAG